MRTERASLPRLPFARAEAAVAALYEAHALGLTMLAHVMLGDRASAEDVVQDAFFGLYRNWARLSDPAMALPYLRRSVLNGCKSAARRRGVRASRVLHEPAAASAEAAVNLRGSFSPTPSGSRFARPSWTSCSMC
jgi:DNA-directed RNA polymerase specialized sigma24 family protein